MDMAINTSLGHEALAQAKTKMNISENNEFVHRLQQASKNLQKSDQQQQDKAKLWATCKDMEAVFLNLMLSRMRATVPKNSLFGKSSQEETMQSLLDTEMTKNLAQAGGIGLANMMYKQLAMTSAVPPKKG